MRLHTYLQTTYLTYFAAISGSLAAICCVIELVEKIRYTTEHGISALLSFAALQFAPTFLSTLPISCWLATLAALYHLHIRTEWHTCHLLGLTGWQKARPLIVALSLLMMIVITAKHIGLDALAHRATTEHQRLFTHTTPGLLTNIWHYDGPEKVYLVTTFDTAHKKGTDLTIATYAPNSTLRHVSNAATFTCTGNQLQVPTITRTDMQTGRIHTQANATIDCPVLTNKLTHPHTSLSLYDLIVAWWRTIQPTRSDALIIAIGNDVLPLFTGFLLALLTILLVSLLRVPLWAGLLVYPLWLGSCMILHIWWPTSLVHILLLLTVTGAVIALAKARNCRILISDL